MKQLIAGICLCVGFGPFAFGHNKCSIRFLVDTPLCSASFADGPFPMVRKGTVVDEVFMFRWYGEPTAEAAASVMADPSKADRSNYGCFLVHPIRPEWSYPSVVYYNGKPTRAVELSENCHIEFNGITSMSPPADDKPIVFSVKLNPSVASQAELREERLEETLGALEFQPPGYEFWAAAVYLRHPGSSCARLVQEFLEGNKAVKEGFYEANMDYDFSEISVKDANSCPSLTTERVVPRAKVPLVPTAPEKPIVVLPVPSPTAPKKPIVVLPVPSPTAPKKPIVVFDPNDPMKIGR